MNKKHPNLNPIRQLSKCRDLQHSAYILPEFNSVQT